MPSVERKSAENAEDGSTPTELRPLTTNPAGNGNGALTPRELEVLELVARGARDKDVANALGITARTAEKHLERIRAKMGVRRRQDLRVASGEQAVGEGLKSAGENCGIRN